MKVKHKNLQIEKRIIYSVGLYIICNIERDNIEAEMNKECDSWKLNHPQINTYNMFSGEWNNQRNYTQWKLMLEDAWEDRRKDIQLFFSIIANNIDKWSD